MNDKPLPLLLLREFDTDEFKPSYGLRYSDSDAREVTMTLQALARCCLLEKWGGSRNAQYRLTAAGKAAREVLEAEER